MAGQVGIGDGGLAVLAVHELQQVIALEQDALEALEGLQTDAVGLVGVGVLVHQLRSVAISLRLLGLGELAAQFVEAGLHGGVQFQILLGLVGDVVADGGGLAAVGIGGDGLLQKALDVGGVLIGGGEVRGGLVGVVLGQQIQAGGDLHIADGAHRVRGGDDAARKAEDEGQCTEKCRKFAFHNITPIFCNSLSLAFARQPPLGGGQKPPSGREVASRMR